jgi:hypothetical protein
MWILDPDDPDLRAALGRLYEPPPADFAEHRVVVRDRDGTVLYEGTRWIKQDGLITQVWVGGLADFDRDREIDRLEAEHETYTTYTPVAL